jgi:uncharacterized protein (UPF0276 family)
MVGAGFRAAVEPLLQRREIEVVEWTIDQGAGAIPPSALAVLEAFGPAGLLYGHGVGYSPLSASREDLAEAWLERLRQSVTRFRFRRLSEHFGFCTGPEQRFGAPLPVPYRPEAVAAGVRRMRRLAEVAGVPVGLENLALALSRTDALDQGPFVGELLAAVDGHLHLDLHNLWCQVVNFRLEPEQLLERYPLERARVVHVSGGTWVSGVRRDTHDDPVPEPVWQLLREVLPRLPQLEAVFVERIGSAFTDEAARESFVADFHRARAIRDEVARG